LNRSKSQVKLLTTYTGQRATAQSKTGNFRGNGAAEAPKIKSTVENFHCVCCSSVAEDPTVFKPAGLQYVFLSLLFVSVAHLEFPRESFCTYEGTVPHQSLALMSGKLITRAMEIISLDFFA
jgi:hypothetical protein